MTLLKNYLGENSYPGIIEKIAVELTEAHKKTQLFESKKLIENTLIQLNESQLPILQLKEFSTNAEVLSKTDITIGELMKFISKTIKGGDLNFLVNLAKEEHFEKLTRSGLPSVEKTVSDFEHYFTEPSSVIEKAIKDGIFDKLESNLLMEYKNQMIDKKSSNEVLDIVGNGENIFKSAVALNENAVFNKDYVMYSPIGIRMEDVKNNRLLMLTESAVLSYDRNMETFSALTNEDFNTLEIPESHMKMMQAITELTYNPENKTFQPTLNWDIKLLLNSNGEVILYNNPEEPIVVEKNELPTLLLESINIYKNTIPNFNSTPFIKEADNFVMLVENHNKLVNIDKLRVVRNLNENSEKFNNYLMIEPLSQKQPRVIFDSVNKNTQLFESYNDIIALGDVVVGEKDLFTNLFESQLKLENEFTKDKFNQINLLVEEQKLLNESIKEVNSLLTVAEEGSPAIIKLNESLSDLDSKLDHNLSQLNHYKNNVKLYQ